MPEVRLIDANAFTAQYGDYYAEEGPESGFIGTVGDLIAKQPAVEAEPVRHGRWIPVDGEPYAKCSYCGEKHYGCTTPYCDMCGAKFAERWIPCSERLPDQEGQYIVTTTSGKVYIWSFYFSLASKRPYFSGDEKVVAWMPRPKPYEPPKEEI